MRPLEDLQYILPEPIRNLAGRKSLLLLIAICTFLGIVCVALIGVVANNHVQKMSKNSGIGPRASSQMSTIASKDICLTTSCLEVAAAMSKNIDASLDPCDNFYRYACGGWMNDATVPPGWPDWNVNDILRQDNDQRMVNIVFSRIRRNTPGSAERKMKDFYDVCSHDYGRMKDGGKTLAEIIKSDMGGWYVFDPDNWSNQWNLVNAVTTAHSEFLVDILFGSRISTDRTDHDKYIVKIREGGLGFYYYYYHRDDKLHVMDAYKAYMKTVAGLLLRDANITMPTNRQEQVLNQFVDDAFTQEYRLAQGMKAGRQAGGYWDTVQAPLRTLEQNYTQLDWLGVIRGLYGDDITPSTQVAVQHLSYLQHINEILTNETTDRDRMLNNYIIWRVIDTYAQQLSWEYQVHNSKLTEIMWPNYNYYVPSWEACLYTVENRMGVILAAEISRKHVGWEGKKQVQEIVTNLNDSLVEMVKQFEWMDNVTIARALEKISKMKDMVGFPDNLLTEGYVDDVYSTMVINSSLGYLRNLLNTNKFVKDSWKRKLQLDRQQWIMSLLEDYNMFASFPTYYSSYNRLLIPTGTIRMPLFVPHEPKFLDYGALGSRIGNTLIRIVNVYGRYMWHNGSVVNWWTKQSYDDYRVARACLSDYVGNVTVGPFLINGENVTVKLPSYASSGILRKLPGLKMAYQAYQKALPNDRHPPGLNRTNIQTFFIAAVQAQCAKRSDEERYEGAFSGLPSEEIYMNEALKQMPEFDQAFKCAKDKTMYLEKKCKVY